MAATGRSATIRRGWPRCRGRRPSRTRSSPSSGRSRRAWTTSSTRPSQYLDVARTGVPEQLDAAGLPLGFRVDFLEGIVAVTDVGRAEAAARARSPRRRTSAWQGIALAGLGQAQYLQGTTRRGDRDAAPGGRSDPGRQPDHAGASPSATSAWPSPLAEAGRRAPTRCSTGCLDVLAAIGADRTSVGAVLHLASGERDAPGGRPPGRRWRRFDLAIDILEDMPRSAWLAQRVPAARRRQRAPRATRPRPRRPRPGATRSSTGSPTRAPFGIASAPAASALAAPAGTPPSSARSCPSGRSSCCDSPPTGWSSARSPSSSSSPTTR